MPHFDGNGSELSGFTHISYKYLIGIATLVIKTVANISQMLHGAGIFTNIYPINDPVL